MDLGIERKEEHGVGEKTSTWGMFGGGRENSDLGFGGRRWGEGSIYRQRGVFLEQPFCPVTGLPFY